MLLVNATWLPIAWDPPQWSQGWPRLTTADSHYEDERFRQLPGISVCIRYIHVYIYMCVYRYTDIGTYTDSLLPDSVALNTFTVPQDYFCSAWLRVSEFMSVAPAAYTLRAAHELSPKTYAQWCDSYHTYTYLHICNTHTCKYITYYAAYTYNFGGVTTGLFWSLAILRPTLSVNPMQGEVASGYSS